MKNPKNNSWIHIWRNIWRVGSPPSVVGLEDSRRSEVELVVLHESYMKAETPAELSNCRTSCFELVQLQKTAARKNKKRFLSQKRRTPPPRLGWVLPESSLAFLHTLITEVTVHEQIPSVKVTLFHPSSQRVVKRCHLCDTGKGTAHPQQRKSALFPLTWCASDLSCRVHVESEANAGSVPFCATGETTRTGAASRFCLSFMGFIANTCVPLLRPVNMAAGSRTAVWNRTNQWTILFQMNKAAGLISFSRHVHENKKPPELRERLMEARKRTGQDRCQRGLIVALRWCNKGNTWMCAQLFSMFVQELKHFLLSNIPQIPKLIT